MTGFYPYSEKQAPLFPLNYNWFTEGFGTADLKDAKACSTNSRESAIARHFLEGDCHGI
jgi:hypothetical protein